MKSNFVTKKSILTAIVLVLLAVCMVVSAALTCSLQVAQAAEAEQQVATAQEARDQLIAQAEEKFQLQQEGKISSPYDIMYGYGEPDAEEVEEEAPVEEVVEPDEEPVEEPITDKPVVSVDELPEEDNSGEYDIATIANVSSASAFKTAWEAGNSITLTKNITLDSTYAFGESPNSSSITLNLGTYTLTCYKGCSSSTSNAFFDIGSKGSVTIQGTTGKILAGDSSSYMFYGTSGISFSMEGGTLDGANLVGSNYLVGSSTTIKMSGGTITGFKTYALHTPGFSRTVIFSGGTISDSGTGIYLGGGACSFSMTGGTISNCKTGLNATVFFSDYTLTAKISGGTITGCTTYGVYFNENPEKGQVVNLTLSGNPKIADNKTNIYIATMVNPITVSSLSSGASIGVTLKEGSGIFTSGGSSYKSYFFSDDTTKCLTTSGSNLKLLASHSSVSSWSSDNGYHWQTCSTCGRTDANKAAHGWSATWTWTPSNDSQNTKPSSVTAKLSISCSACSKSVSNLTASVTESSYSAPTCGANGSAKYTASYTNTSYRDSAFTTTKTYTIPASGAHSNYSVTGWTWSPAAGSTLSAKPGSVTATATVQCGVCNTSFPGIAAASIHEDSYSAATCTVPGSVKYTATLASTYGSLTGTTTYALASNGSHNWNQVTAWNWSVAPGTVTRAQLNTTPTVNPTVKCGACGTTATATGSTVTGSITNEPNCTSTGTASYTATTSAAYGSISSGAQAYTISALGHNYSGDFIGGTNINDEHYRYCTRSCGTKENHYAALKTGSWDQGDENQHTSACSGTNCNIILVGAHAGDYQESGITHYRNCSVCGKYQTHQEQLPVTWENANSAMHHGLCTYSGCGYDMYKNHGYGVGYKPDDNGTHTRTCTAIGCGKSDTHDVKLPTIWTNNNATDDNHFGECDEAECYVTVSQAHTASWKNSSTNHWQYCSVCSHKWNDNAHNWGEYIQDASLGHHQVCQKDECAYVSETVNHSYQWVTSDDTYHWQNCSLCKYDSVKSIHSWTQTWAWGKIVEGSLDSLTLTINCDCTKVKTFDKSEMNPQESNKVPATCKDGRVTYTVLIEYGGQTFVGSRTFALPATDSHKYVATIIWQDDATWNQIAPVVTIELRCSVCQNEYLLEDFTLSIVSGSRVAPQCEKNGRVKFHVRSEYNDQVFEGDSNEYTLLAIGHKYGTDDWQSDEYNHWHECLNGCGNKVTAAHSWSEVWNWGDNASAVYNLTLVITCDDCAKNVSFDYDQLNVQKLGETNPNCGDGGTISYTASVTYGGKTFRDNKTYEIPATGEHSWEFVEWVWPESVEDAEAKKVFAKVRCANCNKEDLLQATNVVQGERHEAQCKQDGDVTFTATIELGDSDDHSEDHRYTLKQTGHIYKAEWESDEEYHWHDCEKGCADAKEDSKVAHTWVATWNWSDTLEGVESSTMTLDCVCGKSHSFNFNEFNAQLEKVDPSCADGSATYTAKVEYQGQSFESEKVYVIAATGVHNWELVSWNWPENYAEAKDGITVTLRCSQCQHETTIDATVSVADDSFVAPKCEVAGSVTLKATATAENQQTFNTEDTSDNKYFDIPAKGHGELENVARVEPKCNAVGYEEYWKCPDCNKMFKDAAGLQSFEDLSEIEIAKIAHTVTKWEPSDNGHKGNCDVCGEEVTGQHNIQDGACLDCGYVDQGYLQDAKDKANAELEKKAQDAKKELEGRDDLDEETIKRIEQRIEDELAAAKKAVQDATNPSDVENALQKGIDGIDNAELNDAKDQAKKEIDRRAAQAKDDIQKRVNDGDISSQEGKELQDIIDNEAQRAKDEIGQAKSREEIDSILDKYLGEKNEDGNRNGGNFDDVVNTEPGDDFKLKKAKDAAKKEIEDALDEELNNLEKRGDLTDDEKATLGEALRNEAQRAKDDIDKAESFDDINNVLDIVLGEKNEHGKRTGGTLSEIGKTASGSVELKKAKEDAKNEVLKELEAKLKGLESREDLTEDERKELEDLLRKEAQRGLDEIENSETVDEVQRALKKVKENLDRIASAKGSVDVELEKAKDAAKDEIDEAARKAKDEIDKRVEDGTLSKKDADALKDIIDNEAERAKDDIDRAKSLDDIESVLDKVLGEKDEDGNRNGGKLDEIVDTKSGEDLEMKKAKDEAKGEIDKAADEAKKEVDERVKNGELTEEEGDILKDIIDREADRAKDEVDKAESLEEIEDVLDKVLGEKDPETGDRTGGKLDDIAGTESGDDVELEQKKDEAKGEIDKAADEAKKEIDKRVKNGELTEEEGDILKDIIDHEAERAKDEIDKAESLEDIEDVLDKVLGEKDKKGNRNGGTFDDVVDTPSEDVEFEQKKDEAKGEIDKAADEAKKEVDERVKNGELTEEEGDILKDIIDHEAERAKGEVDKAESLEDIEDVLDKVLGEKDKDGNRNGGKLDDLADTSKEDIPLEKSKDDAKRDLDQAAEDAKKEVDDRTDLTPDQKKDLKDKIDKERKAAQDEIDNAKSTDDVDDILDRVLGEEDENGNRNGGKLGEVAKTPSNQVGGNRGDDGGFNIDIGVAAVSLGAQAILVLAALFLVRRKTK